MPQGKSPGQYLGGKTLFLPDIENRDFSDNKQVVEWARVIHEVLEELNRRVWQAATAALGLNFVGKVTASSGTGTGWYTCSIFSLASDGSEKDLSESADVLNLSDDFESVEGLVAAKNHRILCFKLPVVSGSAAKYAGLEYFGRSTIGLC